MNEEGRRGCQGGRRQQYRKGEFNEGREVKTRVRKKEGKERQKMTDGGREERRDSPNIERSMKGGRKGGDKTGKKKTRIEEEKR